MNEDKNLIEQARCGSQKAFSALYDKYKKDMWWIIYRIVRNYDVADDVTSVAFTKAFTKLDTYIDHISFEMWLKTIAINAAIDYIRRNKKEKMNNYIDDEDSNIQIEETTRSPEKEMADKEYLSIVTECISRLKRKQRDLIQSRLEGLSYHQIAKKLAMPESTVKGSLNKARQRLRELIDTY